MKLQAYEPSYASEQYLTDSIQASNVDSAHSDQACAGSTQVSPVQQTMRRLFDLTLSFLLLLVLAPFFAVFAILIKLDTKGPIFFKQYRVGHGGELFWFYKFRSMVVDAEIRRAALEVLNEASGPLFKMKNDPRITRCGRWMRKYSLDELPQLFNVLKGDMSLVGPRPALPAEVNQYSGVERGRLKVKPGITGLWQVSGRSDLSFEESVALDLKYVDEQSLWLDVKILFQTFGAVTKGRGAY